ncbi:MAG: beta-ketoacyl synthase N-terminal-like domain-containing protein, partial [Candidatus Kariarchaeaceae archaeon]
MKLDEKLKEHYPIFGYNPPGLKDIKLAKEVANAQGVGLIDLQGFNNKDALSIVNKMNKSGSWGIRLDSEEQLTLLDAIISLDFSYLIIPAKIFADNKKRLISIKKQAILVCETTSLEEAMLVPSADLYLIKGHEAAGRIGKKSSFILIQQFEAAGFPFIIQGGVGIRTSGAAIAGGSKGLVFDTQFYLLPESPLSAEQKEFIAKIDATDTAIVGQTTPTPYRVYAKLGTMVVRELKKLEEENLDKEEEVREKLLTDKRKEKNDLFNSKNYANVILPVGQDIAFANIFKDRYSSVKQSITELMKRINDQLVVADENNPIHENSSFAKHFDIKYPIFQGPMANVSERPKFARVVAEEGGLPFLALGSLKKDETKKLMIKTKEELEGRPYGCGIIGLEVIAELREKQLEVIKELKPDTVLVAAGTIDLGSKVQKIVPKTVIHTPAPMMLKDGLSVGLNAFILEGMECGGHIGILSSFVLWEMSLDLLEKSGKELKKTEKVYIILAGGIGTASSTAMISTMISLEEEWLSFGLQLGSAYLFTREIVELQGITSLYQRLALTTKETAISGETVNTRARAVPTPFIENLVKKELEKLQQGVSIKERKEFFEKENLGAARIAVKGIIRNPEYDGSNAKYVEISEEEQLAKGNFLIGQITSVKRIVNTVEDLHRTLMEKGESYLVKQIASLDYLKDLEPLISKDEHIHDYSEKVAIVGMGCVFPDAENITKFWSNIINGVDSIGEVPGERWDADLYYDPNPEVADKTYTKIGAFIKDFKFDFLSFRIPPKMGEQLGMVQLWGLTAAKEALQDAGMLENYDHAKTGVILGNSGGGAENTRKFSRRIYHAEYLDSIKQCNSFTALPKDVQQEILADAEIKYKSKLPSITEDSMPGELPNITSGRIANIFNLRGKNLTTDAACASSLAAFQIAVDSLLSGECDTVLTGGADGSMDVPTFVKFCKIGALSAEGSFPFDERASGFVMGEGAGILVLKRLSDAIKDGDKIYAVVKGIGSSSDGKGKGITAPNPDGQVLAIERALEKAEYNPDDLQFIEAHGTATRIGDVAEIETLHKVFTPGKIATKSIILGSVKSQVGHLKSASAAVSLIKTSLAIYNGVIPPTINLEKNNPKINWEDSPFEVNTKTMDWPETDIRKAGVSSFGFGGTNFHVILEEYHPSSIFSSSVKSEKTVQSHKKLSKKADLPSLWKELKVSLTSLTSEPLVIRGKNIGEIQQRLDEFTTLSKKNYNKETFIHQVKEEMKQGEGPLSLGFAVKDQDELLEKISFAKTIITDKEKWKLGKLKGVIIEDASQKTKNYKLAFLFPGQGSQYPEMLMGAYLKYKKVRETFDEADKFLKPLWGFSLTDLIFARGLSKEIAASQLKRTEYTQPAMFVVDVALHRFLISLGVKPDVVLGHSLGEYAALVAADVLSFKDGLDAVVTRGKAMSEVSKSSPGAMLSVGLSYEKTMSYLPKLKEYVIAANKNSSDQTVLAGSIEGIEEAIKLFDDAGVQSVKLNVSAAFHSKLVADASQILQEKLAQIDFRKPKIPVLSNVTGDYFPEDPAKIQELMVKQVTSPVEWVSQVKKLEEDKVEVFIEVGPKRALTSFVQSIIGKETKTLTCDHPKRGGLVHLSEVLAALKTWGYSLSEEIYEEKYTQVINSYLFPIIEKKTVSQKRIRRIIEPSLPVSEKTTFVKQTAVTSLLEEELESISSDPYFEGFIELQKPALKAFIEANFEIYKKQIRPALITHKRIESFSINLENIGITGAGVGLPGRNRSVFDDTNIDDILAGKNFIDLIPEKIQEAMVDKNIIRVVKSADGTGSFQTIDQTEQVIKLAAQKGKIDIVADFGISEKLIGALDSTFMLAIGAGLEALKDAGIPLIQLYQKTSTGKYLPKDWALPEELQDETGVIFASAFPGYNNLISEITGHVTDKIKTKNDLERKNYFERIVEAVSNPDEKNELAKIMDEWTSGQTKEDQYQFNRKFLFRILSMGHSQFAQLVKAKGPNTQVNAACASTTQALAIAEDWIRNNRCKRVVVIGADDVTSEEMMEWVGAGFLAVGAATTKSDVKEAALPFDKRRHGMIVGMGAVGIVVESESAARERGVEPIVDLLGTHIANSGFHGTRLDVSHIAQEMDHFISNVEKKYDESREKMASSMLFMSHETYTPARGGSAAAEIESLRKTFGTKANEIIIANTKGFTGHAMGAGIEDVIAVKALEKGIIPPIANLIEADDDLGDLILSQGGKNQVNYALRLAAGFGSQLAFALFRLNKQKDRFGRNYEEWLMRLGGSKEKIFLDGRTYKLSVPSLDELDQTSQLTSKITEVVQSNHSELSVSEDEITEKILNLVAEKTGYPIEMLDLEMDLEGDLGIDTVKTAELFGQVRDLWNLPREEGIQLGELSTLKAIIQYVKDRTGVTSSSSVKQESSTVTKSVSITKKDAGQEVLHDVQGILAKKTGYPVDMLEPSLDLEGDLGIDTVKQAELFGEVREKFAIPRVEGLMLGEYSTIQSIVDFVVENQVSQPQENQGEREEPQIIISQVEASASSTILLQVQEILAEKTGYPVDMLEPSLDLEGDLGIDTVKQAELFGEVREKFAIPRVEGLMLGEYSTIQSIVDFVEQNSEKVEVKAEEVCIFEEQRKTQEKGKSVYRYPVKLMKTPFPITEPWSLKGKKITIISEKGARYNQLVSILEKEEAKITLIQITKEGDFSSSPISVNQMDGLVIIPPSNGRLSPYSFRRTFFETLFTIGQQVSSFEKKPRILAFTPSTGKDPLGGLLPLETGGISGFIKALAREWSVPVLHV